MISRNGIVRWRNDNFRWWNARHRWRNAVLSEFNDCVRGVTSSGGSLKPWSWSTASVTTVVHQSTTCRRVELRNCCYRSSESSRTPMACESTVHAIGLQLVCLLSICR